MARGVPIDAIAKRGVFVVFLTGFISATGCSERRATSPVAQEYRLYVSTHSDNNRVFVFDVSNDSLIDSTEAADFSTLTARATMDGRYLIAWTNRGCPKVLGAAGLAAFQELAPCPSVPVLATDDSLVLTVTRHSVTSFSYPEFRELHTDSIDLEDSPTLSSPFIDDARGHVYLVLSYGTGHLEGQQLLAWDYRNGRVHGQWDLSAVLPGTRLRIDSYTMLPGETRLYGVGDTDVGSFVFCYDLESVS